MNEKQLEEFLLELLEKFWRFKNMTNDNTFWKFTSSYSKDFLSLNEFKEWLYSRKNT